MAVNWINIDTGMSTDSVIRRTSRMMVQPMGDGYIARVPDGINVAPAVFTVDYKYVTPAEHTALNAYVRDHLVKGDTLLVPILPEDPSGSTTGLFYIQSYDSNSQEGGSSFSWTITLQEVFV